jgi:hypothetical protein
MYKFHECIDLSKVDINTRRYLVYNSHVAAIELIRQTRKW